MSRFQSEEIFINRGPIPNRYWFFVLFFFYVSLKTARSSSAIGWPWQQINKVTYELNSHFHMLYTKNLTVQMFNFSAAEHFDAVIDTHRMVIFYKFKYSSITLVL